MKGILFKPWKHQAMRDNPDRLWVTRRVIKPQPAAGQRYKGLNGKWFLVEMGESSPIDIIKQVKPRYKIGETAYVKEGWAPYERIFCTGQYLPNCKHEGYHWHPVTHRLGKENYAWGLSGEPKWRNPRTMPATAARDFVTFTDVRPERLQLPLSDEELELEGGERALEILSKLDSLWLWRHEYRMVR